MTKLKSLLLRKRKKNSQGENSKEGSTLLGKIKDPGTLEKLSPDRSLGPLESYQHTSSSHASHSETTAHSYGSNSNEGVKILQEISSKGKGVIGTVSEVKSKEDH